jgi:hypothetical protein
MSAAEALIQYRIADDTRKARDQLVSQLLGSRQADKAMPQSEGAKLAAPQFCAVAIDHRYYPVNRWIPKS